MPVVPIIRLAPSKRPVGGLKLFWRVVDWLDYWVIDGRLRIVDAVYGPEPVTEADRERASSGGDHRAARAVE
jgi:hypothetical protein